jgi:cytochrome P450
MFESMPRSSVERARETAFPIGAGATLDELERDPHPLLAQLRLHEPVSWLPALEGWLVTRRDLALQVMRDADTFTVDDARFSTGRVVGRSMLTSDGAEHDRHRDPFARSFRLHPVQERFSAFVTAETDRLLDAIEVAPRAELRRSLAGPLAVAVVAYALGLEDADAASVLEWYDAIVEAVTEVTAGGPVPDAGKSAFAALRATIEPMLDRDPSSSLLAAAAHDSAGLERDDVVANAAVMMFGGIETTEGMIANAILHLLTHDAQAALIVHDPSLLRNAVEESLRLEPAAAVVDRYATRDVSVAGASIRRRELVTVSIAGANRDAETFPDPDGFDIRRGNAHLHLAFAQGPHVCIGMHLARLEAHTAIGRLFDRFPGLQLDPGRVSSPRGLVFRKPASLDVVLNHDA